MSLVQLKSVCLKHFIEVEDYGFSEFFVSWYLHQAMMLTPSFNLKKSDYKTSFTYNFCINYNISNKIMKMTEYCVQSCEDFG